jgi:DNA polymerase-1
MFFDDVELTKASRVQLAELPPTPETGWRPPKDYPNWQYATAIGFDFEVKEDEFERGPGWARSKAKIAGGAIDLLFPDGSTYTEYRPIRHEVDKELNLPVDSTLRYWRDCLQSKIPKFGANIIYDIGNATDENIWVQGDLYDCQYAEALLTQDDLVSLEACLLKYCNQHKESSILYEWCAKAYGGEPTASQRSNIYRSSPKLAGPYGEQDARGPRQVLAHQYHLLKQQGLWDLFRMECDLIWLWVMMRKIGCRIDMDAAQRMFNRLSIEIKKNERKIYDLIGRHINVNAPTDLEIAYRTLNVEFPLTPKTQKGSFKADWLREQTDDFSELVLETRQFYKLRDTFIGSYIFKAHINGRIHGQFHPLRNEGSRGESGGTVTGRLSSSTPDLQNIPSRTKLGKEIMKMFLPDEGHACFESGDYSQIEYREFMHFAIGPKADEFRQKYIDDPKTDYHKLAQQAIKTATGLYIPRNAEEVLSATWDTGRLTMKEVNFGKLFGVGEKKVSAMAHCPVEIGRKALDALDVALPFIKPSQKAFTLEAKQLGYITTVLGRRYRFDLWEAIPQWDDKKKAFSRSVPLPYYQAIRTYGAVQRAGTHRAMAGRCQGSAADTLKYSLWRTLKDGVFDVIGWPKLTVHDQLGRSVIDTSPQQEEAGRYFHWVMENALKLRVPVLFKLGRGPNWGSVE